MKKSSKKSVLFFVCIFTLMACLVFVSALDVGGIRAKAAEILYAAGDINGDGEVNGKDLTRLSKFMAGLNPGAVGDQLDTNKDGSINSNDITHLMRYIAGEIPELSETVYHTINFYDDITGYTNTVYYSENAGYTKKFPDLTAEGRDFKGWSTKDNDVNGEYIITSIPKGSKETYNLHACWTFSEYKITYIDAPQHFNVEKYTIEDEVVFSDPQWNGLRFSHWTDSNGEKCTSIPKGTTGNITVTANWFYMENTAIPTKEVRELWYDYDEENGHQIFVYELGEIEHVVLKELDRKYKKINETASWSEEITVALDEGTAEEVSKTLSSSVSKSMEHSEATERAKEKSNSHTEGFSVGIEISPIKDILSFNGGGNFEWSDTNSESWSNIVTDSEGKVVSNENTIGNSSTVTFNNTVSRTFSTSVTVGENMPEGTYRYVYYGTAKVYGVITYEPVSGNYRTDTFSVMEEEIGGMTLYEPPKDAEVNIKSRDVLPYDVPFGVNEDGTLKAIDEYMSKAYFVNYDANGGTGSMYTSAHRNGEEHKLSENCFVKPGYTWTGWLIDGEDEVIAKDEMVSDLATNGETITAKAQWVANSYTVKYDVNKPINASSIIMNMPKDITCVYDTDLRLGDAPKLKGWTFCGWYKDIDCKEKVGDATEKIEKANLIENGEINLYAKWEPNTYKIIYNSNYEQGITAETEHTYDAKKATSKSLEIRSGYEFLGWSTDEKAEEPMYLENQEVVNLSTGEDVVLYAVWLKVKSSVVLKNNRDKTLRENSSYTETVSTGIDRDTLVKYGYTKLKLKIKVDRKRTALFCFNYGYMHVERVDGTHLIYREWPCGSINQKWSSVEYEETLSIDSITSAGDFMVTWGTWEGGGEGVDGWVLGTTTVTVEAIK